MRAVPLCVALLLVSSTVAAQAPPRRAPARPAPTPSPAASPRRPAIIMEPHRARDAVAVPGVLDGPVAVDALGRASFVTDEGVLGQLAADGNPRWNLLVASPGGQPALGADGTIYVAARDRRLYAVDADGHLRWLRRLSGRPVRGVAIAGDAIAVALEPARLEVWGADGSLRARVALGARPSAAPVVAGPRTLVPLESGEIACVEGRRVTWRARVAAAPLAPLAVAGHAVYAGAGDGTLARVELGGRVGWRVATGGAIDRSPVLTADGTVIVAAGAALATYDREGRHGWRRPLAGRVLAGPLVADDGEIYLATGDRFGELTAVTADGRNARRVAGFDSAPTRGLALSGGVMWIGLSDETLRRVSVPQRGLASSGWPKARGDLANSGAR